MKSLEQSIKQSKPFESLARKTLVNVIFSGHEVAQKMDSFFADFGLSHKQYNVMRILRGAGAYLSTSQVKERMMVKNADVSRIVDRLINKGLLTKCTKDSDKRQISISITQTGLNLLEKIDGELIEIDKKLSNLSESDLLQLNKLLDKLRANY